MGTPPDMPPGARNVVVDELPLPISEQSPPDLPPIPDPGPDPDPGGGATIAT
ncbi:hypothetical protein [Streptomyces sp. NPDC086989]|uniref:hypothetical protein n=1 Tax=Streptomyces sp. NPDC086989 TaxID=3365764 RepID=UPI0038116EA1